MISTHGFLLLVCWAATLCAQTTTGIEGTVFDPSGLPIQHATVVATEVETNIAHTATANDTGRYQIVELPAGRYRIEASAQGFQKGMIAANVLSAGQVARGDFQLRLQTETGSVEVRETLPPISASAAEWGNGTERESLRTTPLNGRDLFELAADQRASSIDNINRVGFVGGFGQALSLNGGRPNQNGFQIDGIHINDATGLPPVSAAGHLVGIESIQELSVVNSPFTAEYGRAAAAVVTAVSRSGGNDWHASAYENLRNNALDARNFFDIPANPQPAFRRNQFGGLVSGPILHNKLFFLFNPEWIRQTQALTNSAAVPDSLARQGFLPQAGSLVQVPIAASVQPYLALYPQANGRDFGDGTANYTTAIPTRVSDNYYSAKVDAAFSPRWRSALRAAVDHATSDSHDTFQFYDFHNETHYGMLNSSTQWFTSTAVIQTLQLGVSRNWNHFIPDAEPRIPSALSFLPGQPFGVLQVSPLNPIGNNQAVISNLLLATTDAQFHYQISVAKGPHSLKAGIGYAYTQINPALDVNTRGYYIFSTLASFLAGTPVAANLSTPGSLESRSFVQHIGEAFLQYENRVSRSLTLSAGLRYEPYTAPVERHGGIGTASYPVTAATITSGGPLYRDPSRLNFAPRVALAWNPGGASGTVIRAGFGIFHDILGPTIYAGNRAYTPSQYQTLTIILPSFPNLAAALANVRTPPTLDLVDYHVQQPYVMQYQFLVEHQAGKDASLEAGYIGSGGRHLAGHVGNINTPQPAVLPGGQLQFTSTAARIDPAFGQIGMLRTQFDLSYNALTAGFRKRLSHGLRVQANYTFGKAIDETSDVLFQDFLGSDKMPNVFNYRANRARADYDMHHAFSLNYSYALPLSGWEWSGLVQAQSGHPFSPDVGFDRANLGGLDDLGQRPDLVPNVPNLVTGSPSQYFNPLAFTLPAAGTLGNLGRNILTGPGLFEFDSALQKRIRLSERHAVTLRLEAFNLLNHPNFQLPGSLALFNSNGSRVGSAGQITATSTSSRQLQLAIRYTF